MEKERTVILKRKENIPYDFNINEEYKKYESIGDNKSELKTYKNWESHIINKCSQFTETTRLNFVHYIKGKKRSEENKIATLDAIWMPLNIFVLTVLLTFMFAFVELIKNYNAAASEIVTNYFVSNTDKLYEQTARLLEFNFKESIIFYGMFSVIILITGVATQIKNDVTGIRVSPELWLEMKITDYANNKDEFKKANNDIVRELKLENSFCI